MVLGVNCSADPSSLSYHQNIFLGKNWKMMHSSTHWTNWRTYFTHNPVSQLGTDLFYLMEF